MSTRTQSSILEFYEKRKPDYSWQDIADILNTGRGAAWEIAHGKRAPTQDQELRWMFWLTFGPSADYRTIPAIPCPTCGQLHQAADCHGTTGDVVIVPAGARIVQPKAPAPKRRRVRLDVTRYAHVLTPDMMIRVLDEAAADVQVSEAPPAWVTLAADNLARLRDGR